MTTGSGVQRMGAHSDTATADAATAPMPHAGLLAPAVRPDEGEAGQQTGGSHGGDRVSASEPCRAAAAWARGSRPRCPDPCARTRRGRARRRR